MFHPNWNRTYILYECYCLFAFHMRCVSALSVYVYVCVCAAGMTAERRSITIQVPSTSRFWLELKLKPSCPLALSVCILIECECLSLSVCVHACVVKFGEVRLFMDFVLKHHSWSWIIAHLISLIPLVSYFFSRLSSCICSRLSSFTSVVWAKLLYTATHASNEHTAKKENTTLGSTVPASQSIYCF